MEEKEFYENERVKGNTYDITGNDSPDYRLPFYQAIFSLMKSYANFKLKFKIK